MRTYDLLAGIALGAFGFWIYRVSVGFPQGSGGTPGPGLYPSLVAIILMFLGALLALKAFLSVKGTWGRIVYKPEVWRVVLALALIASFIYLWAKTRFEVAAMLYLLAMVSLYGKTSLKQALTFSVIVAGSIYLLFGLALGVPLELGV